MISLKPRKRLLTLLPLLLLLVLLTLLLRPHLEKRCAHIAVITAPNHGSQKLLSSADNCADVSTHQHLWTGSHPSVTEALTLVSESSVAILPKAFYNHSLDVRTFLRFATGKKVPVVVLQRNLEDAWDNSSDWMQFKREMGTFFGDVKKTMRVTGVHWDTVVFEQLWDKRIYVKSHDCYIRNCLV